MPPSDPEPFRLDDTLDLLARTPAVLDALLRGLSLQWTTSDEGPETWSPLGVVGHLVHGEETDWLVRARLILREGDARPFVPFEREAHLTRFAGWPLETLLDRFAEVRAANLAEVRAWDLSEEDLARPGLHPALGPVTLRQLLATWTVHDLSHLAQISRAMGHRYGEAVGPWRAYLRLLQPRPD
jgi:hypothetical protein